MKEELSLEIHAKLEEINESLFSFVENDLQRKNLLISWKHIIFHTALEEQYNLPESAKITVYKTVIIYLGSIIECLIAYKLDQMVRVKKFKKSEVLKPFKKFKNLGKLYQVSDDCRVCGVLETQYFKEFSNINFYHLNKAAEKSKIFDRKTFLKAEKLRKIRNKIHLNNLQAQDGQYSKPEMEHFFGLAYAVVSELAH